VIDIAGLADLSPGKDVPVVFRSAEGERVVVTKARIDTQTELRYFREGGILPSVVREKAR
jgi:aconitate hydratase